MLPRVQLCFPVTGGIVLAITSLLMQYLMPPRTGTRYHSGSQQHLLMSQNAKVMMQPRVLFYSPLWRRQPAETTAASAIE